MPSAGSAAALDTPTWLLERWAQREQWFAQGEGWLGRAGIGLVAFGLIFLFRYAVDRGWLTPELRIATGLALGGGLLAAGLLRFEARRRYRQILLGGGVVILFITGLAASELYRLVPGVVALGFEALVAGIAFAIAARQRDAIMASIGATGALLPPAVLLQGSVRGTTLWLYLLLMVVWTGSLIVRRGWPSLTIVAAAAGVLATLHDVPPEAATRAVAVLVLIAAWAAYGALPLVRRAIRSPQPDEPAALPPALLVALPVLVTLGLATAAAVHVLDQYTRTFEYSVAFAAAGFALLAVPLARRCDPAAPPARATLLPDDVFAAAVASSLVCCAIATLWGFAPPVRYVALALLGISALALAERLRVPLLVPLGHALNAVVALEFLARLEDMAAARPFDRFAIGFAVVGALALVAALRLCRSPRERLAYFAATYIIVHALLATELGGVAAAPWLGSASYAAVGSALVLAGLSWQHIPLQRAGLLSLALLVLRLFTHDLARADLGVRIVLFLVCGFAFLGLSYVFRARRIA